MINVGRCPYRQLHSNHVKSWLQVHEVLPAEIMFTQLAQFINFFCCDRQRRMHSVAAPAGFYFTKNKILSVFCDNVNLTQPGAVIAFNYAVTLFLQKITGNLFSGQSCVLTCLCHSKLICSGLSLKERRCNGDSPYFVIASRCCLVGYPM